MFIGRHLILFFPKKSSKTVLAIPTAHLVGVMLSISPILCVCQYGLSGPAMACLIWSDIGGACRSAINVPDPTTLFLPIFIIFLISNLLIST